MRFFADVREETMKLIPLLLAALLIGAVSATAYLFYSPKEGKGGTPEGISVLIRTMGPNYSVYVGLRDSAGRFVSSAGQFNFTAADSRGHKLFSYTRNVQEEDFRQYRINESVNSRMYSFNFSRTELKPGVPLRNGSGIAQITFTQPNGHSLRQRTASLAIRALPRISVENLNISKLGSVGAFVIVSWSPSNFTAYSGDTLAENVSLTFFNSGDEGVPFVNIIGIRCLFSVNTTGFQLVGVLRPGAKLNANPAFLASNGGITITLVLGTPDFAYSGPLAIQVSMEPVS